MAAAPATMRYVKRDALTQGVLAGHVVHDGMPPQGNKPCGS